jgi:hypothetical protein
MPLEDKSRIVAPCKKGKNSFAEVRRLLEKFAFLITTLLLYKVFVMLKIVSNEKSALLNFEWVS